MRGFVFHLTPSHRLTGFPWTRYDSSESGGFVIPQVSQNSTRSSRGQAQQRTRRKPAVTSSDVPSARNQKDANDFDRLEQVVTELVAAHRQTLEQNALLRTELDERVRRIRELEDVVLESNQKRQDVIKRVDELIAQIDQLDAQLAHPKPQGLS